SWPANTVSPNGFTVSSEPVTDDARTAMREYLAGHQRGRLGRVVTTCECSDPTTTSYASASRRTSASCCNRAGLARFLHQDRGQADDRQDRDGDRESHTGRLQSPPPGGESLTDGRQRDCHIRDDEVSGADLGATAGRGALGDGGQAAGKADPLADAGYHRGGDQ